MQNTFNGIKYVSLCINIMQLLSHHVIQRSFPRSVRQSAICSISAEQYTCFTIIMEDKVLKVRKSGLIWTNYAFEWILYCDRCTVCILMTLELRESGADVPGAHTTADATNGHCYSLCILVYEHAAFSSTFVHYKWFSKKKSNCWTEPALLSIFWG